MSNATQHSRQSGDSRRRRSRGGRKRNQNQNQHQDRRGGDRGQQAARSEEFRPKGPRPPRGTRPVKLTWWQKLLKAVGLYKAPSPPAKQERKPDEAKPRAPKSNTRNARSTEAGSQEKSGDGQPRKRSGRGGENRPRGGDRASVESARVYVGNLSYEVTEQDLQELFKGIGGVRNVEIVYNRSTHRSKGYGFVEMLHMDDAIRAVEVLHDQHFMGRKLTVSGAKSKGQDERDEKEDRPEREARPVVVAPIPTAAQSEPEPEIPTIVENVAEAADVPATAETPEADAPKSETV